MSEYNDSLFLAPKTNQYGGHMVMTNVSKPTKTKYINIDTKFRDEYNYLQTTDYNITLPERITEVNTVKLFSTLSDTVGGLVDLKKYCLSNVLPFHSFGVVPF